MKKLFSRLTGADRGPDAQFGTGLWRHNHDRFLRAVDRYYATALAIHEASAAGSASAGTSAPPQDTSQAVPSPTSASELITSGTHRLNDLVPQIDEITAWLHTHCPVDGQVVPGHVRRVVGDVPELLTKASAKVAEAVLAASMARTHLAGAGSSGTTRTFAGSRRASVSRDPLTSAAEAADRYITDAAELLERVQRTLAEAELP